MSLHVHQLDRNRHTGFLAGGRQDPTTKETLKEGNRIVICADCKVAHLKDCWELNDSQCCCCHATETLEHVPCYEERLDITQSPPRISPDVRERRNKYIGLGVGLSVLILIIVANITNNKDKRNTKIAKEYTTGKSSSDKSSTDLRPVNWVFGFSADLEQIKAAEKRNMNQSSGGESVVVKLNVSQKELSFNYLVNRKTIRKANLKKKPDGWYEGVVDKEKTRKLRIWLTEDKNVPGNYVGYIQDWDARYPDKKYPKIAAYLIKKNGWLGITAKNISPALAKSLNTNITEGVIVEDILNGSLAQEAGFECNDILIMFDEKPVSNVEQLKELVDQTELGKQVKVVVLRNGSEKPLALSMGEQIVSSNEIAQEVSRDAVATVEVKKQITFAELISGEKDASFFDSHYSEFNYEYDDVWEAGNYVLNKQKEKIITADKESGVIITDTCKWSMNRKYYKYYILIEKTDETTAKLNLKLIAHNSNFDGNLKRSVLKPMNRTFVNDKYVKKFIYEVREKLGDKK